MKRKRFVIAAAVLMALSGVVVAVWIALGAPPPRLVLAYGLSPDGGPSGRTRTNSLGMEFVEVRRGYRWVEHYSHEPGGPGVYRLFARLLGRDVPARGAWVEVDHDFWIMPVLVSNELAFSNEEDDALRGRAARLCRELHSSDAGLHRLPTEEEFAVAEQLRLTGRRQPGPGPDEDPVKWMLILDSEVFMWKWKEGIEGYLHQNPTSFEKGFRLVWIPPDAPD